MKKIYIIPATIVAPFSIESYLHNISAFTLDGASNNGGSNADGEGIPIGEDKPVAPGDFAKYHGFYSSYDSEW